MFCCGTAHLGRGRKWLAPTRRDCLICNCTCFLSFLATCARNSRTRRISVSRAAYFACSSAASILVLFDRLAPTALSLAANHWPERDERRLIRRGNCTPVSLV